MTENYKEPNDNEQEGGGLPVSQADVMPSIAIV